MLCAVTATPFWVTAALQDCVTAWPFPKLNVTVQPVSATVPLLRTVTPAWKPPRHWLRIAYVAVHRAPAGGVGVPVGVGVGVGEELVGGVPGVSRALSGGNHLAAIFWLPASLGWTPSPVSVASLN